MRSVSSNSIWQPLALAGLAVLVAAAPAVAQQGSVSGRVVDAQSAQPLSGAQVFIPDTEHGTLTGEDGRFRLSGVPAGEYPLRARILGYRRATRTVEIPAGGTVTVNFSLQVSAVSLDEVVVTATGQQRNREIGAAISTIDASQRVEDKGSATLADLIQGETTGITIQQNSGTAGVSQTIRIRGASSIGLDNTPLVFVDGARVSNSTGGSGQQGQSFSRLNDIRPEDIESIEVVKGPAAATLYGTAAATGVIRITTKAGASGDARISFRGEYGANWDETLYPTSVWHPQSFLGPSATDTLYTLNILEAQQPFRTGEITTTGASIRGGREDITYYASGEWTSEEGVVPGNGFKKWNVRANASFEPTDFLDVSLSNGFTSNFTDLPQNDNNTFGFIPIALVAFPWAQPLNRDGVQTCPLNIEIARLLGVAPSDLPDPFDGCQEEPAFGGRTFADLETIRSEEHVERYIGSATATLTPTEWLSGRFTVGYDQIGRDFRNIFPVDPGLIFGDLSEGFIDRLDQTSRNLTLTGNASATFDVTDQITSTTTVGAQWFDEILETTEAIGRNFPAGSPSVTNAVVNEGDDDFVEEKTLGLFLQQQFGWKDRLFVTPAIRFDDNSAFGAQADVQDLKKINASYVISDEPWFPDLFETLRLRAAWGESAKQPGTNDALSILEGVPVIDGGAEQSGVLPQQPANTELQPETSEEFEAGFDATVLDGRLSLTFTYYDQTTRNAIVQKNLAPSVGFPDPQFTNIGEMVNNGIEATLDAVALDLPDLTWDWRVNLSTNENEITELSEPIVFDFGNSSTNGQRHEEGRPFAAYVHRPVTIGPDGSVQVGDDLVTSGRPTPEWEGSVSSSLTLFSHVTLRALLDFQGGHQLFNNNAEFRCNFLGGGEFGGTCTDLFEVGPDGEPTDEARIKQVASAAFNEFPFVEDADFARLRNVSLRLDAPEEWAGMFSASAASLTLTLENAALFTGYSGLDPEANEFGGDANGARGEFLTQPLNRRFLATLNLTF